MTDSKTTRLPVGSRVRHLSDQRLDGVIEAYDGPRVFVRPDAGFGYWFETFPFTAEAADVKST